MKLKSLSIQGIHGLPARNYEFGPLTYLHGKNGAGKSTVLQSIQLGLLGYIPGMNKKKSDIFKNATDNHMSVKLTLDDNGSDVIVTRVWAGAGSNISSTYDISPAGYNLDQVMESLELPIFNFNDFIGMTSNQLKDWFINFLPEDITDIVNWEDKLKEGSEDLIKVYPELIKEILQFIEKQTVTSELDEVRIVNQYLKDLLSSKKRDLNRIQSTIQSLVHYEDVDGELSEEALQKDIDYANKMIQLIKTYYDAVSAKKQRDEQLEKFKVDYDSVKDDPEYISYQKELKQIESEDLKIKDEQLEIQKAKDEVMKKISELSGSKTTLENFINKKGVCPFTKKSCDSILTLIEDYKSQLESINSQLQELLDRKDELSSKSDSLRSVTSRNTHRHNELIDLIYNVQTKYSRYNFLKSNNGDIYIPEISQEQLEFDWQTVISESQDKIAKIKANKLYDDMIENLTNEKYKEELAIVCINNWIKLTGANGIQSEIAQIPFLRFADVINEYVRKLFSDGTSFKFNLDSKVNSFSFGIVRNDKYIPYNMMSSGEKCLLTVVLMICILKNMESSLKLILIDDMFDHLDDENIELIMNSIKTVDDIQFVVAGVKSITSEDNKQYLYEIC